MANGSSDADRHSLETNGCHQENSECINTPVGDMDIISEINTYLQCKKNKEEIAEQIRQLGGSLSNSSTDSDSSLDLQDVTGDYYVHGITPGLLPRPKPEAARNITQNEQIAPENISFDINHAFSMPDGEEVGIQSQIREAEIVCDKFMSWRSHKRMTEVTPNIPKEKTENIYSVAFVTRPSQPFIGEVMEACQGLLEISNRPTQILEVKQKIKYLILMMGRVNREDVSVQNVTSCLMNVTSTCMLLLSKLTNESTQVNEKIQQSIERVQMPLDNHPFTQTFAFQIKKIVSEINHSLWTVRGAITGGQHNIQYLKVIRDVLKVVENCQMLESMLENARFRTTANVNVPRENNYSFVTRVSQPFMGEVMEACQGLLEISNRPTQIHEVKQKITYLVYMMEELNREDLSVDNVISCTTNVTNTCQFVLRKLTNDSSEVTQKIQESLKPINKQLDSVPITETSALQIKEAVSGISHSIWTVRRDVIANHDKIECLNIIRGVLTIIGGCQMLHGILEENFGIISQNTAQAADSTRHNGDFNGHN